MAFITQRLILELKRKVHLGGSGPLSWPWCSESGSVEVVKSEQNLTDGQFAAHTQDFYANADHQPSMSVSNFPQQLGRRRTDDMRRKKWGGESEEGKVRRGK